MRNSLFYFLVLFWRNWELRRQGGFKWDRTQVAWRWVWQISTDRACSKSEGGGVCNKEQSASAMSLASWQPSESDVDKHWKRTGRMNFDWDGWNLSNHFSYEQCLTRADYSEDLKWRFHFQFGVIFGNLKLKEVYFEGPNRVWRMLKTSNCYSDHQQLNRTPLRPYFRARIASPPLRIKLYHFINSLHVSEIELE